MLRKKTVHIVSITAAATIAVCLLTSWYIIWATDISIDSYLSPYHVATDTCSGDPTLTTAPWDRSLFDSMYQRAATDPMVIDDPIVGGIVPHHLLAGHLDAQFFDSLTAQKPSTIVIIGPDHFSRGTTSVTAATSTWNTPYGTVCSAESDVLTLTSRLPFVTLDAAVLSEEHSIYGLIPFVRKSVPGATIIPLTLRIDTTEEKIKALEDVLTTTLPEDTVYVASVDFSHYMTDAVARFHDERSQAIISSFDYDRVNTMEIDSPPSIALLLRLMEAKGAKHIAKEISTNASELVGNPSATDITSYYVPWFTKGTAENTKMVSMLQVGDTMLDRDVAKKMGETGLSVLLDPLAGTEGRFFRGIDIISGNLEGTFVEKRIETSKELAFRFDPRLAPALRAYGFTLFTLANNHTLDMGRAGLTETKDTLSGAGIDWYGDPYSVTTSTLYYKTIDGMTLAFIGLNDTFGSLDVDSAVALIHEAREQADWTILNIHWGTEYEGTSSLRQQYLAHTFVDAGADVIFGHHPHVVEELEIYRDRPIFYSLGNFLFDQYFSLETQQELAVGLVLHDRDQLSLYLYPLISKNSIVELMKGVQKNVFLQQFFDKSTLGSYTFKKQTLSISI